MSNNISNSVTTYRDETLLGGGNKMTKDNVANIINDNLKYEESKKVSKKSEVNKNSRTLLLGIGASGSSVIACGSKHNFVTVALNTSDEDCHKLDIMHKYVIPGALGSGGERLRGKEVFMADHSNFISFLLDRVDMAEIDNIAVIYSGGGGTGSSIGHIVARLLSDNFKRSNVFAMSIIGKLTEGIHKQENMRDSIADTIKCGVNYLEFDNDRTNPDSYMAEYDQVNNEIIQTCRVISGEFLQPCRNNTDPIDMKKLWLEKKRVVIVSGYFDRKITNGKTIEDQMIEAVNKSTQLPPGSTSKWLTMGMMVNIEEQYYKQVDPTFRKLVDTYGEPYEMCPHLQVREITTDWDVPDFYLILSALNEPMQRYSQIIDRIKEFEQRNVGNESISSVDKVVIERRSVAESLTTKKDKVDSSSIDISSFTLFD